jgi:DNA-directed RNA polymerase sigma subunit (sigma70/sigma32)
MNEIRKFPLLSEEEEHRYAVSFYEDKQLTAAHTLITSNLRFVVKVAYEFRHYGMKMLDLIQEGNIGLMMAVRKYNFLMEPSQDRHDPGSKEAVFQAPPKQTGADRSRRR